MRVFAGSVSSEPTGRRVLFCGLNWLGDSVMAMPALQAWRRRFPNDHAALLVKPGLAPLWMLHAVPNDIMLLMPGWGGVWRAAKSVRAGGYDQAFVLPHSIRAALVPFLGNVPDRRGLPGPLRPPLTRQVRPRNSKENRCHQAHEYFDLIFGENEPDVRDLTPRLTIPSEALRAVDPWLARVPLPRVVLIPGAARGPSKQWPEARFAEVGRRLASEYGAGILVAGAPAEFALCARVAQAAGPAALNLAGRTDLPRLAALLSRCDVAITNDSGGMHLAAAAGTAVIALFGITDPSVTGPLGPRSVVLQKSSLRSRDVPRDSMEARRALESVCVEDVMDAADRMLTSAG